MSSWHTYNFKNPRSHIILSCTLESTLGITCATWTEFLTHGIPTWGSQNFVCRGRRAQWVLALPYNRNSVGCRNSVRVPKSKWSILSQCFIFNLNWWGVLILFDSRFYQKSQWLTKPNYTCIVSFGVTFTAIVFYPFWLWRQLRH